MKLDALGRRKRTDNRAPTGKKVRLTANDQQILNLLGLYRWLPSNYIVALLGRSAQTTRWRLADLRKEHPHYITCPDGSWGHNRAYQPAVYGLTEVGEQHTDYRVKAGNAIKHDLLTCIIMALMEMEARKHDLVVEDWNTLRNKPHVTTSDWRLPLRTFNEKGQQRILEPDWPPRTIGTKPRFYLYGVEVDRNTESVTGEAHKTLEKMFRDYFDILDSQVYKTLGIPRFLIVIVATNPNRLQLMMKTCKSVANGRSTANFIFTVQPDILTPTYDFPKPDEGDFLSRNWLTLDGTFNFLDKLKGGGANGRSQTTAYSRAENAA